MAPVDVEFRDAPQKAGAASPRGEFCQGIPTGAELIQGKALGGKGESGMQHRDTWRGSRDANPSLFPPTVPQSDTCKTQRP